MERKGCYCMENELIFDPKGLQIFTLVVKEDGFDIPEFNNISQFLYDIFNLNKNKTYIDRFPILSPSTWVDKYCLQYTDYHNCTFILSDDKWKYEFMVDYYTNPYDIYYENNNYTILAGGVDEIAKNQLFYDLTENQSNKILLLHEIIDILER